MERGKHGNKIEKNETALGLEATIGTAADKLRNYMDVVEQHTVNIWNHQALRASSSLKARYNSACQAGEIRNCGQQIDFCGDMAPRRVA